ncbi:hypothetical protein LINPERHAP1_LOCUS9043, partial [Linum perenne]
KSASWEATHGWSQFCFVFNLGNLESVRESQKCQFVCVCIFRV